MSRARSILFATACLALTALVAGVSPLAQRGERTAGGAARRASLNDDWRFNEGEAEGAERPDFDDSAWRRLDLPHDWAIEGPFERKYGPERGALPFFGVGWYRHHFKVPDSSRGRYVSVEFDGAMAHAKVWLNGHELGSRPYGYASFSFDLTPHLKFDGVDNVIAVRLAPKDQSARWYPGAGIYRHVWLDTTGPVHVARWGTYVTTPSVSDDRAEVRVRTDLRNRRAAPATVTLETIVLDAHGREAGKTSEAITIPADSTKTIDAVVSVPKPQRWDVDRPYLYQAISSVREGRLEADRYVTPFGIRTISFGPAQGFVLNGRRVQIKGVCMHHDLGALGAAVNLRAIERQLEILKAMGTNAIRTSHNPPAPELLDAADRMGFVVMDEAFDEWRKPKVVNGHGSYFDEWGERDLRDMIRRDRNHPSIVLWSIGNEVLEQADPEGRTIARRLTAITKEEDPTRPVTSGFNQVDNAIKNGLVDEVDVAGFNYSALRYAELAAAHPNWTIVGAETSSCISSRGVYHLPLEKYRKHPSRQLSSYDIIAPGWGYPPDVQFEALDTTPGVAGEFVWTGFDYLGEPTPYFEWNQPKDENDWPARSSYFGIVDLAGFPKDRYFLYQSRWTTKPMVHLLPHWNWEGREGQEIPVFVYTNASEAELFLNGKSLGRKRRGAETVVLPVGPRTRKDEKFESRYRLLWNVPWAAGTLRAVALEGDRTVATKEVRTAGAPAKVALQPDRKTIDAGGRDLSFVTVRIEDREGNLCPMANNLVRFTLSGPGSIAGVDNGDSATTEPFQANQRTAFYGLALAIVRSDKAAGSVRLVASAEGLQPGETVIRTARR
jgi:beta-galactosidase